jgi:hypothetical protein
LRFFRIAQSIALEHKIPRFLDACAATQGIVRKWIAVGFLIWLAGWFFLESGQQKTLFYILLGVPALCLLPRLPALFRANAWGMFSLVLFLGYFSISALWGEDEIMKAVKISISLFCLLLAIEAAVSRFDAKFISDFVIITGAVAICVHGFALVLSDSDFSGLIARRLTLNNMDGWGNDNPIDSATVLGLPILAAWWRFPGRKWPIQAALVILMAGCALLMFFTQSRGPILALGIALPGIVLFRRSRDDIILLCSACALIGALFQFTNLEEQVDARVMDPDFRMFIWSHTFEQFRAHLWTGQGFGHDARIPIMPTWSVTHAHSFVFEAFRIGGLIGGSLLCFMLFTMVKRLFSTPAGAFFLLWLIYGMLCLSTNGRLLLIRPWVIECFAFWIPLFCGYFAARPRAISATLNSGSKESWSLSSSGQQHVNA